VQSIAQVGNAEPVNEQARDRAGRVYTTDGEWLTAKEGAAYLKIKVRTLLLWARQKKVPAYALCGAKRRVWRFRKADLDDMLLRQAEGVLSSASPSVLVTKGETE
jgi:excisionase family DNA binding protein